MPTHPFVLAIGSFADAVVRPNATTAASESGVGNAYRGHVILIPLLWDYPAHFTRREVEEEASKYSCAFPSLPGSPRSPLELRAWERQMVATCSFESPAGVASSSQASSQGRTGIVLVEITRESGKGGEKATVVAVQATDYSALLGRRRPAAIQTSMVRDSSRSDCPAEVHRRYCLRDWVEYHRMVGIEHFVIYDNLPRSGEFRFPQQHCPPVSVPTKNIAGYVANTSLPPPAPLTKQPLTP